MRTPEVITHFGQRVTDCGHDAGQLLGVAKLVQGGYVGLSQDCMGMTYLGDGSEKSVYDLGCGLHVFKVQRRVSPGSSEHQTGHEIDVYISAPRSLRHRITRIDAYLADMSAIVAEKVATEGVRYTDKFSHRAVRLEKLARGHGIDDAYGGNLGLRGDGRMVLVDYGIAA